VLVLLVFEAMLMAEVNLSIKTQKFPLTPKQVGKAASAAMPRVM
jgi:hypothetical protein